MKKLKIWLSAFRLYSLMVSSAGIILGSFLVASFGELNWMVLLFTMLTTWSLHLLCNISNDYGDAIRQTDVDHDFGDVRYVQDGLLTLLEVKRMCLALIIASLFFGSMMIFSSFGYAVSTNHLIFAGLGIFAIAGAVYYTNGKKPYGYIALGDLSVFMFFGLATVLGSYYLQTKVFDWKILLPALAIGMPIIGLLNNNNIRDIEADPRSGKHTIAYFLGLKRAKIYQYILLILLFVFAGIYAVLIPGNMFKWLFLIMIIPFSLYAQSFHKSQTPFDYHKLMGPISMNTLLFGIIFGLGVYLSM